MTEEINTLNNPGEQPDENIEAMILDLSAELSEVRAEYKALVKTIKDTISSNQAQPAAEQNNNIQAELDAMKRIVGNYHPRPDSLTYEELLNSLNACQDENHQLRQDQKQDAEQIKRLKGETDRLRQKVNQLVKTHITSPAANKDLFQDSPSVMQRIRSLFQPSSASETLSHNNEYSIDQQIKNDSRRAAFMSAVKSPAFSDEQLTVIARAYDENHINTDDFKSLLDPDISYERMAFLYRLLSGKTDMLFSESPAGKDDPASDLDAHQDRNEGLEETKDGDRRIKVDPIIVDTEPTSSGSDSMKTRAQVFARTLSERRSYGR